MTRRAPRRRPLGDAGTTLMEVLVGMGIMSIVLALATSGLIVMFRTANKSDVANSVQQRTTGAFDRLEREIRYAKRIYDPTDAPNYTVAFLITDAKTNKDQCVQLWIPSTGGSLKERRWQADGDPAAPFTAIANDLEIIKVSGNKVNPFTLGNVPLPGQLASNYDRLLIQFTTTAGADKIDKITSSINLQFTALNTVPSTEDLADCTAAVP